MIRRLAIILLLACHIVLLAWQGARDAAVWDEVGHFAAGLSHWYLGRFDLYRVNPPLVRMVGLAPIALAHPKIDLKDFPSRTGTPERMEFQCGGYVFAELGPEAFWLLAVARWACIPFSLFGAWTCFHWSRAVFGGPSALLALALWCLSPTVLAYGHLITPDMGAAGMGVAAVYAFRRWILFPTAGRAIVSGLTLGLAEATKSTWLILLPLFPIFWLLLRARPIRRRLAVSFAKDGLQFFGMLAVAWWTLNLVYGFEGMFKPLGQFSFVSSSLAGRPAVEQQGRPVNRFSTTWASDIPVPVPENYLLGIDFIKMEYERGYWSYLKGEWRHGGWWYYYLYCMLVKEPEGTWLLGGLAVVFTIFGGKWYWAGWGEELVLLVPAIAVVALVSSQTGFNHHLRYVLPAYPFLFIWISKIARAFDARQRVIGAIAVGLLAWSTISSVSVVPHSMSYFNQLSGGPKNGQRHLDNSNTDWGQDLLYLKKWYDKHPSARPIYLGYALPLIDPKTLDIDWRPLPHGPAARDTDGIPSEELGPRPGWFVVSVNLLHSGENPVNYFKDLTPADWIGYTMPVYHISPEEADALRHKYGMPPLPSRPSSTTMPATLPPAATVPATRGGA